MHAECSISINDLAALAESAAVSLEPSAQFLWLLKQHLNLKKTCVKGDRKAAKRDFKRLQCFEAFKISTEIVLNSVPIKGVDHISMNKIQSSRVDLTKSAIHTMMLDNYECDGVKKPRNEIKADERQLDRIVDAMKSFGLCKVQTYEGCGPKKPLVTTPLLTSLIFSSFGQQDSIREFLVDNPHFVEYPIKEMRYG